MKPSTLDSLIAADPPLGKQWRLGQGFIARSPQLAEKADILYQLSLKNPHAGVTYATRILRKWAELNAPEIAKGVTLGTVKKYFESKNA